MSQEPSVEQCPRCNGPLTAYALGGEEAVVCEVCGYVGVSADHRPEGSSEESWEEAVKRFESTNDTDVVQSDSGPPVELQIDTRTYRVTPAIYAEYADLTNKQQAILNELLAESDPLQPTRSRSEIAEAAGVHPSYVSEVMTDYEDLTAALSASPIVDPSESESL